MKKIVVVVVSLIIILCSIGLVFSYDEKYSEKENRYYASWPTFSFEDLISGDYVEGITDYLTDHFIYRDKWIGINTAINSLTLKDEVNGVYLCEDDYLIQKYTTIEKKALIYNSINNFVEANPEVNVQVMLIPTSIVINEDKLPADVCNSTQVSDYEDIYRNLNCTKIDCLDALLQANQKKQVFYRLDHHWTSYGAYIAYEAYCKTNNIETLDIDDFKCKLVANNFAGTLYNKVGNDYLTKDSIEIYRIDDLDITVEIGENKYNSIYFDECLNTNDKYAYFLNGNHPLVTITNNNAKTDETICIIKDSYANCFVQFLLNHYSKIVLIDPRYYGQSIHDYLQANNISNVLFLYNMNSIGDDIGIRGIE